MLLRQAYVASKQIPVRFFHITLTTYNQSNNSLEKLTQNLMKSNAKLVNPSSTTNAIETNDHTDQNLRRIIESSNFGTKTKKTEYTYETKTPEQLNNVNNELDQTEMADKLQNQIQQENPGLPSESENQRSELAKKVEKYLDSIQETLFTLSRSLNDATGYSSIEKLKQNIESIEAELLASRDTVKILKEKYSEAIKQRSQSQKEINELLTRKHDWSSDDLERFTQLYRNDHVNEQNEQAAHNALEESEKKVDTIQLKLTRSILTRYHEEQIWSDKIRRASTWGTWILMGINIMLFIIATFLVEPWKRKKLVAAFENKVKDYLQPELSTVDTISPTKDAELENVVSDEPESIHGRESIPNNDNVPIEESASDNLQTMDISNLQFSKETIWETVQTTFNSYISPDTQYIKLQKLGFTSSMAITTIFGIFVGAFINSCFH